MMAPSAPNPRSDELVTAMSTMNIQNPAPTWTGKPKRRNAVSEDGTP